ncbi:MAG: hypothetical protein M3Y17_09460 [Actinomycetota bacterium]|nr:hypothetical protein [Actinomycetota bacterium]
MADYPPRPEQRAALQEALSDLVRTHILEALWTRGSQQHHPAWPGSKDPAPAYAGPSGPVARL